MQVLVNSDHNIDGRDALTAHIIGVVEKSLHRNSGRITRVEVHLSDENSDKKAGDHAIRCMMEARVQGHQPLAVTHHDSTVHAAVDAAAGKLERLVNHTLDRLHEAAGRSN